MSGLETIEDVIEKHGIAIERKEDDDLIRIIIAPYYDDMPSLCFEFHHANTDDEPSYFDVSVADAEIIIEHLKKVLQKLKKSERDAIHYYRKKKIEPPEPTWISDVWINRFDGKLRKVKK